MRSKSLKIFFFILFAVFSFQCFGKDISVNEKIEKAFIRIKTLNPDSSERALRIANDLLNEALEEGNDKIIGRSYFILGYIYLDNDYQKSDFYFQKALVKSALAHDSVNIADIYFHKGLLYHYTFNNQKALTLFYDALSIYEKYHKIQERANTYQNLGLIFNEIGDTAKALDYYNISLEINKSLNNNFACASIMHNIGILYSKNNSFDVSLKYYKESIKFFRKDNFKEGIATVTNNIGVLYENKGEFDKALEYYLKSLKQFKEIHQKRSVTVTTYNVGKTYNKLAKYNLAKAYLLKSVELAKYYSISDVLADAYRELSNIYEKDGDFKNALIVYQKFNAIDDSLHNMQSKEQIAEIENKYDLELTEKELALKTKKLNKKTLILYVFVAGAFLFLIVIVLLYVENRQKVNAQKELLKHQDHLEDLVKKKTEELKLEISERKIAEESDKLKSAFLANMSHEIRTPMNSIIAFSNYLRDPELSSDKREEYIHYITTCCKNLLQLINDILDIAKIDAHQLKIHSAAFNISDMLKEIYNLFKESKSSSLAKINFRLNQHSLHENISIETDFNRLMQIFINLIENAFKYTNEGTIEFGIEKIQNNIIFFYVSDTGIGIPSNKSKRIFERFQQAETAIDKKASGTGLGLAICKNIVELLGGKIWVVSKPKTGSVFRFTIPYKISTGYIQVEKKQFQIHKRIFDWNNKVILVAEDEDLNYKVIEIALRKTNANLIRAKNGVEAIEQCLHNNVDIILMDIQMPEIDGYKATREIKKIIPSIPVIAQTSFAMAEDRIKCFEAGCDDFITKPLNIEELYQKIERFIKITV